MAKENGEKTQDEHDTAEASDDQRLSSSTETLIKNHVGYAVVAGALPFPLVDIAAITAIQVDMIKQIARQYSADFDEERGRSVVTSLIGATAGVTLGRVGASLLKSIPVVGSLLGIGSQVALSGASTYAIGKVVDLHFAQGGDLSNLDAKAFRTRFAEFVKTGSGLAQKMGQKKSRADVLATIEKMKDLRDAGAITAEEFEETKKKLLDELSL